MIVGPTISKFNELEGSVQRLLPPFKSNIEMLRHKMNEAGFKIIGHKHSPIVPIMIGDAALAYQFAQR